MRTPKVGDKVILGKHTKAPECVRSHSDTFACLNWVSEMEKHVGKVGTVSRIGRDSHEQDTVDVKENLFSWRVRDLKAYEYQISW